MLARKKFVSYEYLLYFSSFVFKSFRDKKQLQTGDEKKCISKSEPQLWLYFWNQKFHYKSENWNVNGCSRPPKRHYNILLMEKGYIYKKSSAWSNFMLQSLKGFTEHRVKKS